MTDPDESADDAPRDESAVEQNNTVTIVRRADGVVGQGTSPWPVEENGEH